MRFFYVMLKKREVDPLARVVWEGDSEVEANLEIDRLMDDPANADCYVMLASRKWGRLRLEEN